MAEGVLFRDIEALVVTYLKGSPLLAGLSVSTKIPTTRPTEFVRVRRLGGPKETLISEAAQVSVEAYAQTESRAALILSQCRAVLNAADSTIFGVHEFGGPINLPDPLTETQVRYTMSFQIRARGVAVSV